jgi:hypothetical protein
MHDLVSLQNLKNDNLRRKFDSIKYGSAGEKNPDRLSRQLISYHPLPPPWRSDVKKIEEVIYDLAIRGLSRPADAGASGADSGAAAVSS